MATVAIWCFNTQVAHTGVLWAYRYRSAHLITVGDLQRWGTTC